MIYCGGGHNIRIYIVVDMESKRVVVDSLKTSEEDIFSILATIWEGECPVCVGLIDIEPENESEKK